MLFANCIPVKGVLRSIIIDSQRNSFKFIPNNLFEILQEFNTSTINDIYKIRGDENSAILDEYFEFLIRNEFAFLTNTPLSFPLIDNKWESPRQITNAIIDIDNSTTYDITEVIEEMDNIGVEALQIRIFYEMPFLIFEQICDTTFLKTKRLRSIQFLLKYIDYTEGEEFLNAVTGNLLTSELIIHSCPFSKVLPTGFGFNIIYTEEKVDNASKCGCINPHYFTSNLNHINEAVNYNTCLNKKIAVDVNGAIKNCPSMEKDFGRVNSNQKIEGIIKQKGFQELWMVKKEQIDTCKICEFRLICTDCRAYVKHKFDKPLKCNYNPYTAKWEN